MAHAAMLLANPFRPDPRVLKEALSLADVGHKLTIIAWDRQAEYLEHEILAERLEIIRIQNIRSSFGIGREQIRPLLRYWKAAQQILDQLQPDLVHCHDFDTLPAGFAWAQKNNIPLIYDAHEYYADLVRPRLPGWTGKLIYKFIRSAERFFARRVQAIITVDQTLADIYRSLNATILVVGHYPSRRLVTAPVQVFTRQELNLLYIGRLSQDRGLFKYLELLERLRACGVPARLVLAGVFTPADEEQAFQQAAGLLREHIEMAGWISYEKIAEILSRGDVGLCLLRPEPRYIAALPVKLFEYMAAGLPVLASDFQATREIVQSSDCGALLDPTDAQAAADIITKWYLHPETPGQLGKNGRQAVLEKYNWENLSDSIDQLYRSLLS